MEMNFNTHPGELLKTLSWTESNLQKSQFLCGMSSPTKLDREYFKKLEPNMNLLSALTHPNTVGWWRLLYLYGEKAAENWPEGPKSGTVKKAAKKDDDDIDLFGDDDEDDGAAAKAAAEAAKKAAQGKKKKKEVVAMSLVMLEVKPLDSETNLDDLAKKIFGTIVKDGLFWKTEYKKEPIAFGIEKLIIGFSCEDEKISVDNDVVEKIEEMEDLVQSVEIQAFNKI